AIVYFIYALKEKTVKDFFKSSLILVVVAALAVLPAVDRLIPTADYSKETMRGGAVLKQNANGQKENSGLEIDYAYMWSYGKAESMTLLIPNFYGGSSQYNLGKEHPAISRVLGGSAGHIRSSLHRRHHLFPVYFGIDYCQRSRTLVDTRFNHHCPDPFLGSEF
ncbi:MAG: hypothetical protein NTY32_06815, partial [Bacteroidia bacterium]|nr:hypothetical protein [Bacteroidia bacterium]